MSKIINFEGRDSQKFFLEYNPPPKSITKIIQHRRAGKSVGATIKCIQLVNWLMKFKEIPVINGDIEFDYPRIGYFAKTKEQARNIIWPYFLKYFIVFPGVHFDSHRLVVKIPRRQFGDYIEIVLKAARNHEDVRGERFWVIFLDEFQEYPKDCLRGNLYNNITDLQGFVYLFGTAKGKDNILYDEILKSKEQFQEGNKRDAVWMYPVSQNPRYSIEEIADIRSGQADELFLREWELNFTVSFGQTYYSKLVEEVKGEFNHGDYIYNRSRPMILAVDIGVGKSFSAFLAQVVSDRDLLLLDYYEDYEVMNQLRDDILETWEEDVRYIALPHDRKNRRLGSDEVTTNEDVFRQSFPQAEIIEIAKSSNVSLDRARVKENFHILRFYAGDSDLHIGLSKVSQYGPRTNDSGVIMGAVDKSTGCEHAADALRYLFVGLDVKDGLIQYPGLTNSIYVPTTATKLTSWASGGKMGGRQMLPMRG